MKLIVIIGFFISNADGALSTMRVGSRKAIRGKDAFEFGRPVDDIDVYAAFQEMQHSHMRFLVGGASNDAGASFPFPGMSFPNPGMSLPNPGMSLPNPGMSLPYGGSTTSQSPTRTASPSMTPTGFQTFSDEAAIHCVDRDSTTSTQIHVQLDVDTLNKTNTLFLQDLATSIVSFGQVHFSLCHKSLLSGNTRLLSEPKSSQEQENVTVTGLDATASSFGAETGNANDLCISAEPGAYCSVVDVILTVFSATEASSAAAEQQVYNDILVKQVEAGSFVNGDILAIRFHPTQNYPADSSAVIRDGNLQAPTDGNQGSSAMLQTILISVLTLVGVAVMLVVGLVLYRKSRAKPRGNSSSTGGNVDEDSKSDFDSIVADQGALPVAPRTATEDSPHFV